MPPARQIRTLTPDDVNYIKRLEERLTSLESYLNRQKDRFPTRESEEASEVHIALTPAGGIAGVTVNDAVGTGSSYSDDDISTENCWIYRKSGTLFVPMGFQLPVSNISFKEIPEYTWIIIQQDKNGDWITNGSEAASSVDEKVKVSSNDTTAGYLNGKLVAGSNITLTENNDGSNETLTIASSGESISGCVLSDTSSPSISSGSSANIGQGSWVEVLDSDDYHDTGSNTERITIPVGLGGLYAVHATCDFAIGFTAPTSGHVIGSIVKNVSGTPVIKQQRIHYSVIPSSSVVTVSLSGVLELEAGDYIVFVVTNFLNVTLNGVFSGSRLIEFRVAKC